MARLVNRLVSRSGSSSTLYQAARSISAAWEAMATRSACGVVVARRWRRPYQSSICWKPACLRSVADRSSLAPFAETLPLGSALMVM